MRPEQAPQVSQEIPQKLWESFGVQPTEGVAQVADAIDAHVQTYGGFADARLEPWAAKMVMHAIRNDAEFCAAFDGLPSSQQLVNQRLSAGLARLRDLPLGRDQLVATNAQLFGVAVSAMTTLGPTSPHRKYLRACAAEFGRHKILGEKLQLIQQQQLACAQQARTRSIRSNHRAAAEQRGQAMEECLNTMGFRSEIKLGKTQSYQLYETGRRAVYRTAAATALAGLGVAVGAAPGSTRDMPAPAPVAVEQTESGVPDTTPPPSTKPKLVPQPVPVAAATLQAPEKTEPVKVAPKRKPAPVIPVQIRETAIQEKTQPSKPIRAEVPDNTPVVKSGETPGQALARVVRLGDSSAGAKLILEQTSGGEPSRPINKKLDQLAIDTHPAWERRIKAGDHKDTYEDRAILSLSFLRAAIKNPAVLESRAGQALMESITKQPKNSYRVQLADAARAHAEKVLLSRENGKLKGYDEATQQAIIELYAYAQLATVSDAKQAERIADMKTAADSADRERKGYSRKAIDAGEAVHRDYNQQIEAIIAGLPNRTGEQRQFLRAVIADVDELRKENPQTNLSVMVAQAIHESGWGKSTIKNSNNLFGVKAGESWTGETVQAVGWEVVNGQRVEYMMSWRAYDSYADSIRDHAELIESKPWFQDAVAHKDNPAAYLDGLLNPGGVYATDPNYKTLILQIIDGNRINEMIGLLDQRDHAAEAERNRVGREEARAAAEVKERERQEQHEQQGGMSNGQEILDALSKKYGGVSGKLSASELATFDAPYTDGSTVRMSLQHEAAKQFQELDKAYRAQFGVSMVITDHYRDYETQVQLYDGGKNPLAAPSGTSNHGWGLAVDMGDAVGGNFDTEKYRWMAANAPKYGWINPGWAKPGPNYQKAEPWHWEYLGSVALENPDTWLKM